MRTSWALREAQETGPVLVSRARGLIALRSPVEGVMKILCESEADIKKLTMALVGAMNRGRAIWSYKLTPGRTLVDISGFEPVIQDVVRASGATLVKG
jgi:hypothetical protein